MSEKEARGQLEGKSHVTWDEAAHALGMDSEDLRQFAVRHSIGPCHTVQFSPFILIEDEGVHGRLELCRTRESHGTLINGRQAWKRWFHAGIHVLKIDERGALIWTDDKGAPIPRPIPLRWSEGLSFPPSGAEDSLRWGPVRVHEHLPTFYVTVLGFFHFEHESFQAALSRSDMSFLTVTGGARRWVAANSSSPFQIRIPEPLSDNFPCSIKDQRVRVRVADVERLRRWKPKGVTSATDRRLRSRAPEALRPAMKKLDRRSEESLFKIVCVLINGSVRGLADVQLALMRAVSDEAIRGSVSLERCEALFIAAARFVQDDIGKGKGLTLEEAEVLRRAVVLLLPETGVSERKVRTFIEAAVNERFPDDSITYQTVRRILSELESSARTQGWQTRLPI